LAEAASSFVTCQDLTPTSFIGYPEKVVYRYLDRINLHNGVARVKCKECGHEYLLAFSCKRAAFTW